MKLRYVGESFRTGELTNGQVYDAYDANDFCYCVKDNSGKKVFYSKVNPAPFGSKATNNKWEVVEA